LHLKIEKIKKRLEWFLKSPKEYAFCIRELEDVLGLPHTKIIPWIDEGFWPHGNGAFLCPIIWPFFRETPLQVAIHEVRHLLQWKHKVRLISFEEVKDFAIKEEIEKLINKLKKEKDLIYLKYEIDALIVEVLGQKLITQGKIEEFKNLMLKSILPTSFFILEIKISPAKIKQYGSPRSRLLRRKILEINRRGR
jgi:hypothetical protein